MNTRSKLLIISSLIAVKLIATACTGGSSSSDSDDDDFESGSSGGGLALPYGNTTYNFTCPAPSNTPGSVPIPPTSTPECEQVYRDYAFTFGCNQIDDFATAQSAYESCLIQDETACQTNGADDPNCL